jgi:hypothetical protein
MTQEPGGIWFPEHRIEREVGEVRRKEAERIRTDR